MKKPRLQNAGGVAGLLQGRRSYLDRGGISGLAEDELHYPTCCIFRASRRSFFFFFFFFSRLTVYIAWQVTCCTFLKATKEVQLLLLVLKIDSAT